MLDKHIFDILVDPDKLASRHITRLTGDLRRLQALREALVQAEKEGAGTLDLKRICRTHNDLADQIEKSILVWYLWQQLVGGPFEDKELSPEQLKRLNDATIKMKGLVDSILV